MADESKNTNPAQAGDQSGQNPEVAPTPATDQSPEQVPIERKYVDGIDDPGAPEQFRDAMLRGYDPTLDPGSPDFDLEKYERMAATVGGPIAEVIGLWQDLLRPFREQGQAIADSPSLKAVQEFTAKMAASMEKVTAAAKRFSSIQTSDGYQNLIQALQELALESPELQLINEIYELKPYLEEELKKPEYNGLSFADFLDSAEKDGDGFLMNGLFIRALEAAREAQIINSQKAGREERRKAREKAIEAGALMTLRHSVLPFFSGADLQDAFNPSRIVKMGEPARKDEMIDRETGQFIVSDDDIVELKAGEIPLRPMALLSTIIANSVENFRDDFIKYIVADGTFKFYVKGVLDSIGVDPRTINDQRLDEQRKTAGARYLESLFKPLLPFLGTTPDGSRYAVLNYYGYDASTDTMRISTPYLYQLWHKVQKEYEGRQINRQARIDEGKRPLKKDLKPLEINDLILSTAREDDTTLEIAVYITNTMLAAGKKATRSEFTLRKLIKDCERLREELAEVEAIPDGATTKNTKDGTEKKINKTSYYNTRLRKIGSACNMILDPNKMTTLNLFQDVRFYLQKNEQSRVTAIKSISDSPTKSMIKTGKLIVEYARFSTQ